MSLDRLTEAKLLPFPSKASSSNALEIVSFTSLFEILLLLFTRLLFFECDSSDFPKLLNLFFAFSSAFFLISTLLFNDGAPEENFEVLNGSFLKPESVLFVESFLLTNLRSFLFLEAVFSIINDFFGCSFENQEH